jgi:hypothetical protein
MRKKIDLSLIEAKYLQDTDKRWDCIVPTRFKQRNENREAGKLRHHLFIGFL